MINSMSSLRLLGHELYELHKFSRIDLWENITRPISICVVTL